MGGHREPTMESHGIHGAAIYANMTGVYSWDPWHTIYTIHGSVMGIEATQPLGFCVALNGIQLDFVRQMVGFDRSNTVI